MTVLLVLIINALMGLTFSIVRLILDNYTDPIFLVGYRMTLAGIILLAWQFFSNKVGFSIKTKNDWWIFFKTTIFHVYICYIFEFWSQKYLLPAKIALLFNLTPFATAFFSYLILQKKQSFIKIVGLLIGFIGFLPIIFFDNNDDYNYQCLFGLSLPELALLVAVFSSAYAWLIVEYLTISRKYSIIFVNGFAMFWGGMMALLTSFLVGNYGHFFGLQGFTNAWQPWPFVDFVPLTGWVLVLILFSNLIYYNVYAWLMSKYSPTFLAFSGLTIPFFAAIWEWLLFGITVSYIFWLSLLIISLGLAIYYYQETK